MSLGAPQQSAKPTNLRDASSDESSSTADKQSIQLTKTKPNSVPNDFKPIVVGIYGIPGCGKTFLFDQLKRELEESCYEFYEGSQMIASLVPGGLAAFQKLDEEQKSHWREVAIDTIWKSCLASGKTAVVAGHFMFWQEGNQVGQRVYTRSDLNTYTHILYLDVPAEIVAQRRQNDTLRSRSTASVEHLRNWQKIEKTELRDLCRQHNILFSLISSEPSPTSNRIAKLLRDFRYHTEEDNLRRAESRLDDIVVRYNCQPRPEPHVALVMDGDRTLAALDTGRLFWQTLSNSKSRDEDDPLKAVFSSTMGYSYAAFRQVALLYEEAVDDHEFDVTCEKVALTVTMHPEFVSLLRLVAEQDHVLAIVVTCGLGNLWEKILAKEGLSERVQVIGGGRIADGLIVTASVKATLVSRLRDVHHMYVSAFGDSTLDLGMLGEAHEAIVVVGEEHARSTTMEKDLLHAIDNEGLRASQVLLPPHASPRLDTTKLPQVRFTDKEFMESILRCRKPASLRIVHATDRSAAKLLMTPMRDAMVSGPALRKAHGEVGSYLATEFLTGMIGLEEYAIPHVQGHATSGFRLHQEQQTTIVALMRGGEPMALGVNSVFPLAMFVHATQPSDIKPHHLHKQRNVLLVDSVVNSGKSVAEFVQHIRSLDTTVRIIVIAGVVQAQSLSKGVFSQALEHDMNLSLVALRLSDNRFTGKGTTDTGNRLFNTTHLP
ncbi:uracil phosphoribosyltransferase-domain-containing protein [Amanita rubescens]|nr:uracil phosphoribosyltransferase-domain-containing protein [Amanita rubescens]